MGYFGISHVLWCREAQNWSIHNEQCKLDSCPLLMIFKLGVVWAAYFVLLLFFYNLLFRGLIYWLVWTSTPYSNISPSHRHLWRRRVFPSDNGKGHAGCVQDEKASAHTDLELLASFSGSRRFFLSYWGERSWNYLFGWPVHFCFFLNLFIVCLFVLLFKALKKGETDRTFPEGCFYLWSCSSVPLSCRIP